MFKTETHAHTLPVSTCSQLYPDELVRLYRDAGYHTLFISDHFSAHHFAKLGNLTFEDKVRLLYGSYLRAAEVGEKLGIRVLFSVELSLCSNHWLLYGVTLEFLLSRPDVFDMTMEEFYAHAKANGITIIEAHPLRDRFNTPHPEFADGFEVINSCRRHKNYNQEVMELARKHHLLMSAGSDAHCVEDVGGAAMLSEREITSVEDYLELLRSGEAKMMENGIVVSDRIE